MSNAGARETANQRASISAGFTSMAMIAVVCLYRRPWYLRVHKHTTHHRYRPGQLHDREATVLTTHGGKWERQQCNALVQNEEWAWAWTLSSALLPLPLSRMQLCEEQHRCYTIPNAKRERNCLTNYVADAKGCAWGCSSSLIEV